MRDVNRDASLSVPRTSGRGLWVRSGNPRLLTTTLLAAALSAATAVPAQAAQPYRKAVRPMGVPRPVGPS